MPVCRMLLELMCDAYQSHSCQTLAYLCDGFAKVHYTSPTGLLDKCPRFMFVGPKTVRLHVYV